MYNVGRIDAALRTLAGLGFFVTAAAVSARPFLSVAAVAVGLVLLGTGVTRFCPLYTILGMNTTTKSGTP
jgi:hypothetical protein